LTREIVKRLAEEGPLSPYDFARKKVYRLSGAEKDDTRPHYSYVHGHFKKLESDGLILFYKDVIGEKGMKKKTYWLGEPGFLYALNIARTDKLRTNVRKLLKDPSTLASCEVMLHIHEKSRGEHEENLMLDSLAGLGKLQTLTESPETLRTFAAAIKLHPTVRENGIGMLTKVLGALGGA